MSKDDAKPRPRTVRPNAARIRQLRTGRGWTVEKLAEYGKCSTKTIDSLERGNNAFLATIGSVARAFNVDTATLIEGTDADKSATIGGSPTSVYITLIATIDFSKFDATEDIWLLLRKFGIRFDGDIDLDNLSSGSVWLSLIVEKTDALRLFDVFCDGRGPQDVIRFDFPQEAAFVDILLHHAQPLNPSEQFVPDFKQELLELQINFSGKVLRGLRVAGVPATIQSQSMLSLSLTLDRPSVPNKGDTTADDQTNKRRDDTMPRRATSEDKET